ncbi:MAG: isoprenylcysteine carboxylmethyltransferase family protein [Candidatus Krumholzibacteria bacterium]|nr:isoprenylcysteine carboxylmethyltransferase family protein [Candidatus Krumholzibacteria bacterium]
MDWRLLLKGTAALALLALALAALAGRIDYWQGWAFAALNIAVVSGLASALAGRPVDIASRMRGGSGGPRWDRVIMAFFYPLNLAVPVVAALDAGRLQWSSQPPLPVTAAAMAVYGGSAALHLWSILSNRYYIGTVRILAAQGHTTQTGGPYRIIRHPGYAGIIGMLLSAALCLGSTAALVPAGGVAVLLVVRAALEDDALRRSLPGYREYAARVRFRLIPGLW